MADLKPFLDRLLSSLTLSEIIGKYVELKKSGTNHFGLCPFHHEKSPSFSVNDQKGIFHCFGCGASGNALSFLMKYKELPFKKALIELCHESGTPLPEDLSLAKLQKAETEKDRLTALNQRAAKIYHETLLKSDNPARRYLLEKRKISPETLRKFYLGYAPDQWDTVMSHCRGIAAEFLEKSGLFGRKQEYFYDRFRNKVMFPIFDVKGSVIAFGSRVLDDSKPKYINSPETPVFKKRETLYGLNLALEAIRKKGFAYVVEGYMDTLALHQAGFENTVAPLGTAFSEDHIKLLSRYAKEATLLFDGDEAGKKAAARSVETALQAGFPVKIITLPENLDPDEFIENRGKAAFAAFLESSALSWEDYLLNPIVSEQEILLRRKKIIETLKLFLGKDPLITNQFLKKLSGVIGSPQSELEAYFKKMNQGQKPVSKVQKMPEETQKKPVSENRALKLETEIALLLLNNPSLYLKNSEDLTPAFFSASGLAYRLFSAFIQCFQQNEFKESLFYSLASEEDLKGIKHLIFEGKEAERYRIEPEKQLLQIKTRLRLYYVQGQIQGARQAIEENSSPETHEELNFLLSQEKELKNLMSGS